MSPKASVLLERLAHEKDSVVVRRLRALLQIPQAHIDTYFEHSVSAGDIAPTWRVRQKVAKLRKKRFLGISTLVSALEASPSTRQIEIANVRDEIDSAEIFFDAETKALVGAVIVKMSAHTRAFYRGELTGNPWAPRAVLQGPAKADSPRTVQSDKVMA